MDPLSWDNIVLEKVSENLSVADFQVKLLKFRTSDRNMWVSLEPLDKNTSKLNTPGCACACGWRPETMWNLNTTH